MSLKFIEDELNRFIKSKNAADSKVIVIKGKWGTGKTHFWEKIIKGHPKEKYAYISLFGINSITQLKGEIFFATNSDSERNTIGIRQYASKLAKPVGKFISQMKFEAGDFVKSIPIPIEQIGWEMTQDTLICFDDIERKGEKLDLKDFFGLVSILKERKNCKILIILNEEEILKCKTSKEIYLDYREKVIDEEITFSPEISEISKIVFNGNSEEHEYIRCLCKELNLTNIRTYFKIKNYIKKLENHIVEFEDHIQEMVRTSIIREIAKNWEGKALAENERDHNFNNLFEKLVKDGFDDLDKIKKTLNLYNKNYKEEKSQQKTADYYYDIVYKASHSFKYNENEIANMIINLCNHKISPNQANMLLKIVEEDIKKPELTKNIIDAMEKGFDLLEETINNEEAFGKKINQNILGEFEKLKKERYSDLILNKTAKEVLDAIVDKIDRESFLSETQLIQLDALEADDIVNYYRQIDIINKDHKTLMQKCLGSHYANQRNEELHAKIMRKFSQVLIKLAGDDSWNKKKIGWLGFEYDGLQSNIKENQSETSIKQ